MYQSNAQNQKGISISTKVEEKIERKELKGKGNTQGEYKITSQAFSGGILYHARKKQCHDCNIYIRRLNEEKQTQKTGTTQLKSTPTVRAFSWSLTIQ